MRAGDPSAGFNPLKFSTHLYLAIDSWFPPPPAKEDVLHLLDDLDMILNLKRLDVDVEGIALIDLERMSTMPLYKWATPACIVGVLDEGKITKVALAFERISLDAKCRTCTSPGFQKLDRSKNTPEHNRAGDDALTTFVNRILKETVNRLLSSNQNIDLLVALDIEKARAECAGIPLPHDDGNGTISNAVFVGIAIATVIIIGCTFRLVKWYRSRLKEELRCLGGVVGRAICLQANT